MTRGRGDASGVGDTPEGSPYHAGERAVQTRLGTRARSERVGRIIRDTMPEQHREFFATLPFALLALLDTEGFARPNVVVGPTGFLSSPDPHTLRLALQGRLDGQSHVGAAVGVLGIELPTRRRNRLNGTISAVEPDALLVRVEQSFGNCKQYITARSPKAAPGPPYPASTRPTRPEPAALGAVARELVGRADTFFIASSGPPDRSYAKASVDVSHRGGPPGFVSVHDARGATELVFADYPGNDMFNTLGNLELERRAGLLFIDFASHAVLTLRGEAEVEWGDGGSSPRRVRFRVIDGTWQEGALPFDWSPPSPAAEFAALR